MRSSGKTREIHPRDSVAMYCAIHTVRHAVIGTLERGHSRPWAGRTLQLTMTPLVNQPKLGQHCNTDRSSYLIENSRCAGIVPSALIEQLAKIDDRGIGPRHIVGHDKGVICEKTEATTIENDGTENSALTRFQLANDLAHADQRILVTQHRVEVHLHRLQEVHKCPGGATRFIENIVDLHVGRSHRALTRHNCGLLGCRLASCIGVHLRLSDTRTQPLREAAKPRLHIHQPA